MRRGKNAAGAQIRSFDRVVAEMLVEPRPPGGGDPSCPAAASARRREPAAAAHQAEMAAVLARHQFENGARLAVALDAEHDAFVGPFHRDPAGNPASVDHRYSGKLQAHLAVALGIVAPAFAHLHEQKQVHRLLESRAISVRASAPIALMVWPPLPSTILRWLSRST